jgi:putative two-component system response regulator
MPAPAEASSEGAPRGRILVIDDDAIVRCTVAEMLARTGYEPVEMATHEAALRHLEHDASIRLVVSDIVMPGLDGFELTEAVRQRRPSLPVLLITGAGTDAHLSEALARGAAGLIAKPFTMAQLGEAVAAVLQRAERSEQEVRQRFVPAVLGGVLASVLEARDGSVRGHCDRLADLAEQLAERLGVSGPELETVSLGALLHDIGKIGIPDSILLKPGPLDDNEWVVMRSHTEIGDRLLAPFAELAEVRTVVRHHHERWDGHGYPDGLVRDRIPIAARIVAVADAVEAMSVRRPYRDPLPIGIVVAELEKGRGTQWDPVVIDSALELILAGGLSFGVSTLGAIPPEAPIFQDEDLARFAETRLADLVRMLAEIDPASLAELEHDGSIDATGGMLPGRRREALEVLTALRAVLDSGKAA